MSFSAGVITLSLCQIAWIMLGLTWLSKRHDDLPLLISTLLFYVFTFRFWALLKGWTSPVNVSSFGFDSIDPSSGLEVQALAVLGQTVLLAVYMLIQKRRIDIPHKLASADLLIWLKRRVLVLAFLCFPLVLVARHSVSAQVTAGRSLGFEVSSYLILLPLSLVGIAILLAVLCKSGAFRTTTEKLLAAALFAGIGYLTFGPSLRFQFLGWFVGATIIFSAGQSIARRFAILTIGLMVAVSLFAVAGAMRNAEDPQANLEQTSWERFAFAVDANMLDGFALLRQVYPEMLPYSHGMEHVEILERPIPRSWWPDKPVGGYMNKLGLITADSGFGLGISPSLFGSFYQEGGPIGIVLLSAIYGFAFARLIMFSTRILPLGSLLIRGMLAAGVVPLLRGGDLPGIYAWFGMSFWPCLGLLWLKRRELLVPALVHQRRMYSESLLSTETKRADAVE